MELNAVLFYVLAFLTGTCAVAVVVTGNIVRAAAWLLFALAGTAGVFFLLNADFVGSTQLLVYVGGTLVLVVFGVMLTAQGPFITMRIGAAEWAIGLGVGLVLYAVLALSLVRTPPPAPPPTGPVRMPDSMILAGAFLGSTAATPPALMTGVDPAAFPNGIVPSRTRVAYLLPFEIVSVHLLVVLIGAAYLARAKRRRGASS
jgi:NADH-quinone oxidoreductase subunit J